MLTRVKNQSCRSYTLVCNERLIYSKSFDPNVNNGLHDSKTMNYFLSTTVIKRMVFCKMQRFMYFINHINYGRVYPAIQDIEMYIVSTITKMKIINNISVQ